MCVISAFTVFPNNVLPVMSSFFDALKENPLEDLEYSMDGLESFTVQAIEQRIIILCLKMVSVTKKTKLKNNNNCQLSQDRGFMHNGPQRGKVGS